jgi:hypothetical protein
MSKYRVLKSVAHNFAHSQISSMSYGYDDYFACHLIRASRRTGLDDVRWDVVLGKGGPEALIAGEVGKLLATTRDGFVRLVETGGSSMALVHEAHLSIRVLHGAAIGGGGERAAHARVLAAMVITDDRGREHHGEHLEEWSCEPRRRAEPGDSLVGRILTKFLPKPR